MNHKMCLDAQCPYCYNISLLLREHLLGERNVLKAEVERLQSDVADSVRANFKWACEKVDMQKEIELLRAENMRIDEALEIASGWIEQQCSCNGDANEICYPCDTLDKIQQALLAAKQDEGNG